MTALIILGRFVPRTGGIGLLVIKIEQRALNQFCDMAVKKQFNSFQELISSSNVPVLVDFYATWCGPCQMMSSIIEQVNARMKQQVQVVKIDTDKYPQLASEHQIHALPTLVVFKNGQPVDRIEGVLQADQLIQRLQSVI
jgi:thioredoxin